MVDPTRPEEIGADETGSGPDLGRDPGVGPSPSPSPGLGPGDGRGSHLDLAALNAVLDGSLDPADRASAAAHLASCAACTADLAELQATAGLLHGLPQYRPRRSFTLGPEHAKRPRPVAATGTSRFLPTLPALRVATLAVAALLLLAVVGEWAFGRPQGPTMLRQPAPVVAPAGEAPPAPALDQAPAVREAAPAGEGEDAQSAGQEATGAAAGAGTGGASRASQGADGVPPAAAARATPSPWRLAQIGLGLTLLWLVVSLVGLGVVRRLQAQP